MKIAVTGGSGKVGRAVVRDLLEHGHDVLNVDRVAPDPATLGAGAVPARRPHRLRRGARGCERRRGAAGRRGGRAPRRDPVARPRTPDVTFCDQHPEHHTVFAAAARLGLQRVVWASSETTLGLPFDTPPTTRPSTSSTRCGPDRATRSRRCSARRWHGSSRAGAVSRSSGCASPTSWSATTTSSSPPTGMTRSFASGTSGATSTRATSAQTVRQALSVESAAPRRSSSRPPTPSCGGGAAS